jgi:hypothetical protein
MGSDGSERRLDVDAGGDETRSRDRPRTKAERRAALAERIRRGSRRRDVRFAIMAILLIAYLVLRAMTRHY